MNSKKLAGSTKPSDSYGKQKEFKPILESKKPPAMSFESELAMAQKSLKLLKAKMATPKVQDDYASNNFESKTNNNNNYNSNSRNDNISSANENNGNGNNNYRKVFKPDLGGNKMDDPKAKPKNNYPLEEIQRNDFGKKPDIKLMSKMNQDKKPGSMPSQDDFEYYDRNTRDYSKYQYQEETTKPQQQSKQPANNSQKNLVNNRQVDNYGQEETLPKSNNLKAIQKTENSYNSYGNNQKNTNNYDTNNNKNKGYNQQYENSQESDVDENEDADKVEEPDEFEDPSAAQELVQCTMGCGRSFKADFIKKHMKICKKVFQSKRKAFDSSKNRTVLIGEEEYQVKKKAEPPARAKPPSKKENWKNKSESFRSMLKMAKGDKLTVEEEKAMNQAREDAQNLIQCNSCGRKFNEKAAEKHISFCEKKSKLEKMKAGNNGKGRR